MMIVMKIVTKCDDDVGGNYSDDNDDDDDWWSALPSNLRQVLAHDGPICPGTQLASAIVIIIIKKII